MGGTAGCGIRIFPCKEISQPASLSSAPPEQATGSTKASHATARPGGCGSAPRLRKSDPRGGRARNGAQRRVRGPSRKQDTQQCWVGEVKGPVTPAGEQWLDWSGTGKGRCWDWERAGAGQEAHGADSVGMGNPRGDPRGAPGAGPVWYWLVMSCRSCEGAHAQDLMAKTTLILFIPVSGSFMINSKTQKSLRNMPSAGLEDIHGTMSVLWDETPCPPMPSV